MSDDVQERGARDRVNPVYRDRFVYLPSIYGALVLAMLTAGALYVLVQLEFLLVILFLSVLLACGIARPVAWLERLRLPRAAAILVIYLMVGGLFTLVGWYAIPPLLGQAVSIAEDVPDRFTEAQRWRDRLEQYQVEYPVLEQLDERLIALGERAGAAITQIVLDLPSTIAQVVFAATSILTLTFLMVMVGDDMKRQVLQLVRPRHRELTDQVLTKMGIRLGAYLRAKVIVMSIVGTWVYITLLLLNSPFSMLVAIFAAITELLPRIGPWIGRAAIVISVAPLGWKAVAIAVASHVVIENLKGSFISPLVEGDQVDIHPLTAFIAVIAGGILMGWIGALIAVPIAAVIQVVVEDVLIPWRKRQIEPAGDTRVGPVSRDLGT